MLKAVIFDMDGVLIDSEPIHKAMNDKLFRELGVEVTDEEYDHYVGTNAFFMWGDIKKKHNLKYTINELVEMDRTKYHAYITNSETKIEAIVGINNLLIELKKKGIKIAVASSSPISDIESIIRILKIDKYFDVLVSGDMVKHSKPYPDIFLYAADKLEIGKESIVIIEDSTNGVKAAIAAGISCLGYKNINSGNQDLSIATNVALDFNKVDLNILSNVLYSFSC